MIVSRSFYIEHRMCVGFARLNLEDPIPTFESLEQWEQQKSTKLDTCARMCRHLLARDDAPEMLFENGTVVFPPIPTPSPGEKVSQEDKILIYQEFPSLGPLLRNVSPPSYQLIHYQLRHDRSQILALYDIKNLFMDGQTPFSKRAKIVQAFQNDPTQRVLITSSVGAKGLNLIAANKIIFAVSPSHSTALCLFS